MSFILFLAILLNDLFPQMLIGVAKNRITQLQGQPIQLFKKFVLDKMKKRTQSFVYGKKKTITFLSLCAHSVPPGAITTYKTNLNFPQLSSVIYYHIWAAFSSQRKKRRQRLCNSREVRLAYLPWSQLITATTGGLNEALQKRPSHHVADRKAKKNQSREVL